MNAVSVDLRPVRKRDHAFLLEVYGSTREDVQNVGWTDFQKKQFLEMQFKAQSRDYEERFPNSQESIVSVDGVDAGRLWVYRTEGEILVLDIALLPARRNSGAGAELMTRLIQEALDSQRPLRHSVYKGNTSAVRFYERLGFIEIEDLGLYLRMEWRQPS